MVCSCGSLEMPVEGGEWPPREWLVRSLVEAVPETLRSQDPSTGRFGCEPWVCRDQNVIFPLAAAWALDVPGNRYHRDPEILDAVCRGGDALVAAQDEEGMWIFRKKDNSTWGQIHMPWTYSRWIRAYALVREAMPAASRQVWEKGLLLGFERIRRYADGRLHNIPTHHAMALDIAGQCFGNREWREAARRFMGRVVAAQDPDGFWSEHYGPVVGYNGVYIDALGVYYAVSGDASVLEALRRAAIFHAAFLWSDGSAIAAVDERQIYRPGRSLGNVGFSHTREGRGYLLAQVGPLMENGQAADADYAASMLLYGGSGAGTASTSLGNSGQIVFGGGRALVRRVAPWEFCFSAYACPVPTNRWQQDRHNLVDIFHDELGLVVGGGNTKLQPYWSTFTVGNPELLRHEPGEEAPDFCPDIDLLWVPDSARLAVEAGRLDLKYGAEKCSVTVLPQVDEGSLRLRYQAAARSGKRVEAHVPFFPRQGPLRFASGHAVNLDESLQQFTPVEVGGFFAWDGLRVTMPANAVLRWPMRQHNPYAKDGHAPLANAKLVLVLPFTPACRTQDVVLSRVLP